MREHEIEKMLGGMTVRQAASAVSVAEVQAAKAERDKIVALLRRKLEHYERSVMTAADGRERLLCADKASVLFDCIEVIERGDHLTGEGA